MRIETLLPLDFWRQEMGYNPWHFWGCADLTIVPVTSKCNDVVREYAWMNADEVGRSELRQAIATAEGILHQRMEFWPAPAYTESKVSWPKYFDSSMVRLSRTDSNGGWVPVRVDDGYVKVCGVKAYTELSDAAALIYTDQDGDGLKDTFICSVATTITDPDEIAIYFVSGDRLAEDNSLSDRWRIEPVTVTFLAGTATIMGKRWLCVKPSLYEGKSNYPIDPSVDSNFITSVSIFRRYTYMDGVDSNVDSQAALIWESKPCSCGCGSPVDGNSDPASEGWVAARSGVRDSATGLVTPAEATYDAVSGTWVHPCGCLDTCGEPDKVLVRYLAGMPLDEKGWMQKPMRTLVSRLAAAEMNQRICACDSANREWSHWQFDLSRIEGPETYQANLDVLNNPLGTRRGHIYAWQQVLELARVVGILV